MKRIITVLILVVSLIMPSVVYASGPEIECTAEVTGQVGHLSGRVNNSYGRHTITVLVGNIKNITKITDDDTVLFIYATTTDENGDFSFMFRFPDSTPSGTYSYYIGSNTGARLYKGNLQYVKPVEYVKNQFFDAKLDVTIKGYIPTISGTISCAEGKTVSIDILNTTNNTVIANDTITAEDGAKSVSYTLPNLWNPKDYDLTISCKDGNSELVRVYAIIDSAVVLVEASGEITPAENVELGMQMESVGMDLINQDKTITAPETFSASIPNLVSNASVNFCMQGYEYVEVGSEDDESNSDCDIETILSEEISGGFETQDEIGEVQKNSFDGARKIVENGYSGKFALQVEQKTEDVLPVMESDYFFISDAPDGTEKHQEKANIISMKIKPMYKADFISFYVKAKVKTDSGINEEYVLIKGDKGSDGVYEVGEDLSLGKWQNLELDLDTIEEEIANQSVSGIYVKANSESIWFFDELGTDYRSVSGFELDLQQFAKGNVVYDEGLKFVTTSDGMFNTEAAIVTSGIDVTGELHSIEVESYVQHSVQTDETVTETDERGILIGSDFSSENWIVDDVNYDEASLCVSKKSDEGILMKGGGVVKYTAGDFSTEDRVKIELNFDYNGNEPSNPQTFMLELYKDGEDSPYYTSKREFSILYQPFQMESVLPKIEQNTEIRITYVTEATREVNLSSFKLYPVVESDWNSMGKYNSRLSTISVSADENHSRKNVTDLSGYAGQEYAVTNKNLSGVVNNETSYAIETGMSTSVADSLFVIRMVNLSNEDQIITVDDEKYYLPFGEYDIVAEDGYEVALPSDPNVLLVSVCHFSKTNTSTEVYSKLIEGISDNIVISYNGDSIYYTNYLDGNAIYKYDINTKTSTKVVDKNVLLCCVSNDERNIVYSVGSKYYIYDTQNGTETGLVSGENYSFNSFGELFYVVKNEDRDYHIYRFLNGVSEILFRGRSYAFDNSGNYMFVNCDSSENPYEYTLYKYYNNAYTAVDTLELTKSYTVEYLLDDLSAFNSSGELVDLKTGEKTEGFKPIFKAKDGTFITSEMKLYNPIQGKGYKITDAVGDVAHYNPDSCMLTIVNNGYITRCKFTEEKSSAKYLLSFDGKNTWQSYKNGRWITVVKGAMPTESGIDAFGMTSDELNNITPAAYKNLYNNGTDILQVDIAIYMNSTSNKSTPVINKVAVNTKERVKVRELFSIRTEEFNKEDYINVISILPFEDFNDATECYYLLCLDKECLYTYKDSKLIKIEETADELFDNIDESWIMFKQYAMNVKELRSIPAEVLTNLLVNPDSSNTEFSIVYVLKGENTTSNMVTFNIEANTKYINADEVILEIKTNGEMIRTIDSREYGIETIEEFLVWLENRQQGRGADFFVFRNEKVQLFVNYYMLDSINVYDAANYTTMESDEQSTTVLK